MTASQTWKMTKSSFNEWSEDKAMRLAAALACYTIISLAPLVVISLKVASVALGPERAEKVVTEQMTQLIGPSGAAAIGDMINNAAQPGSGTLAAIISFVILLFSASGVFAELQDSMNTVWEVKPRPNLGWWDTIKKRFFSMGMVFGIVFLLLTSMFITATLGAMVTTVTGSGGTEQGLIAKVVSYSIELIASTTVIWICFMLIFKYLPDVKIGLRDVWLGALVTAVLFKLGQYGLALYFKFGSTTSAYGAAGSLVAVLLWAYYSACILFFGAEFTQAYARQMGGYIEPDEDAVPVTDEERAQHGMPRKRDVEESYAAVQLNAGHRGGMPRLEPVPQRRVVTITRPAPGTARSAGIAAAGLAAGFVVAAIGLLKGRKYERQGLEQIRLKKRLERVEDRVRQVALHEARMARTQSNGNKPQWKDQFASIKSRVREALHV